MSDNPSVIPYWRLSSFYFFYFAVVGALTPYWGIYLKSLGYSSQDVGIIGAIILGTRIIAPNFWGWLADKTHRRLRIIRVGSALACVCFAAVLVDQRYSWLVVVISCYTFFWHAVLPQFEVITLAHLDNQYQRYSQIRLWGSLGFMVSVSGLGSLFNYFPVKFLPLAILSFLLLIWCSSLSLGEKQAQRTGATGSGFLKLISHPTAICFLVSSFLLQLSHGPYYTFYSLYLKENNGYSSTATGLLWALGVLAEIAIFVLMPLIMRHFTVRTLLLIAFFVAAIRWFLIGCYAQSLMVLLLAQLLHAFTFGIAHAASIEFVRHWFSNGNQGQGQALYSSFSFGAGGASGALIGAFMWDYSASATFLISSVAALSAFVISYLGLHFSERGKINSFGE